MAGKDGTEVAVAQRTALDSRSDESLPPKDGKIAYSRSDAFVGGASEELYEPIAEYEGRHRFDP